MKQRQLGQDGPMVSALGLGCWSFAGAYGPTTEAESHETLDKCLELGIDFLDTANVYRGSEKIIGNYITSRPGAFKIATKGGITRDPDTNERIFNNRPEHLRKVLETSLSDLGVEHVELYYIHRREEAVPIEDVMGTLLRFKEEGKIGGIGFSEISPASLRRAHAVHPVMAVQNEYSLWSRMPDLGLVQTCKELGVTFVPFSPLGRGVLTSRELDPSTFPDSDFRKNNPRFLEPNFSHNMKALAPFKAFAAEMGATPAELAIAWCIARGEHLIPIPGTRSAANLEDCARGAARDLGADEMAEIERILPVGFAHGDRYSVAQLPGAERYC
ncbi:MAG: aldo/keto reductase [Pseudomonadota bacterium]